MSQVATRTFVYVDRDLHFAVPVMDVIAVVFVDDLRPGHRRLPGYLGNMLYRDRLLPLLDSVSLIKGPSGAEPTHLPRAAVAVRSGDVMFALSLDRYLAVVALDALPEAAAQGSASVGIPEFAGAIESVRAYRDNALIVFSSEMLARRIEGLFGDQRIVGADDSASQASAAAETADGKLERFLCVTLGQLTVGIPVEQVIEVIEDCEVTPFFGVDPILRGLINLRGEVVACIDVSTALGFAPRELLEKSQYVILQGEAGKLALCIDRVDRTRQLPVTRSQEPTEVLSSNLAQYLSGVLDHENESIFLISVAKVFDSPQLAAYQKAEA